MDVKSAGDNDILRVANCSGFYGDRLSAAKEMVDDGPIDVLTGDYLAELTMAILANQKSKNASMGYVGTFVKQVRQVLADCLEKNIKIVTKHKDFKTAETAAIQLKNLLSDIEGRKIILGPEKALIGRLK